jgi:hypothetical protein
MERIMGNPKLLCLQLNYIELSSLEEQLKEAIHVLLENNS